VPDVFRTQQLYDGCDATAVLRICRDFMHRLGKENEPVSNSMDAWDSLLKSYSDRVTAEATRSATRALFHDHFHQYDAAEGMKGATVSAMPLSRSIT